MPTVIAKHLPEYDRHEQVVRLENKAMGVVAFIAIHRRRGKNPSFGATRLWSYAEEQDALRDSLRLSRLMSYKSAFAGLPYGGAKAAIITKTKRALNREELFSWYAGAVSELAGAFVTGSDVGVTPHDVDTMRSHSPFIVGNGVPAEYYTAISVLKGIEAAADILDGSPDISGKTFAVQGLGKTGLELVRLVYARGGAAIVSDVNEEKIAAVRKEFPAIIVVAPSEIHRQSVDFFTPCALQHSINRSTIGELRCRAIVGSANNQLEHPALGDELYRRGIVYIPDYIANNGGLISVADHYVHGKHDDMRIKENINRAHAKLLDVLAASRADRLPPHVVADRSIASLVV